MSASFYLGRRWLPLAPDDFARCCREIAAATKPVGAQIAALAHQALDNSHFNRVAGAISAARASGRSLESLTHGLVCGLRQNAGWDAQRAAKRHGPCRAYWPTLAPVSGRGGQRPSRQQ